MLDTHAGRPAAGVAVELYEFVGESPLYSNGYNECRRPHRQPLIGGRPLPIGRYELRFADGQPLSQQGYRSGDPPFLDIVPLRFSIAEPEGHYHVPLLCTPWSYSTYRGS
jgi:Transthyretin-like protein